MSTVGEVLRNQLSHVDDNIYEYIEGILIPVSYPHLVYCKIFISLVTHYWNLRTIFIAPGFGLARLAFFLIIFLNVGTVGQLFSGIHFFGCEFIVFFIWMFRAGVLDGSADDFRNCDDVYEAVGEVLHDVANDKAEGDIRYVYPSWLLGLDFCLPCTFWHTYLLFFFYRSLCQKLLNVLRPGLDGTEDGDKDPSGGKKLLGAPVVLSNAATYMKEVIDEDSNNSIWIKPKSEDLVGSTFLTILPTIFIITAIHPLMQKVDTKKLEKAEAKLQQKQQTKKDKNANSGGISNASASQVLTKKETRMEAKGTNNCKDIRIENFDIAFGDK